jgi:AraC-like DNA-binding protein
VRTIPGLLDELRDLIAAHARPDLRTPVDGLRLSKVETSAEHHSLAEPLLVVMAQGGKRLLLGDRVFEYRAGECLVVTAELHLTGHFIDASPQVPALAMGLALRPAAIAPLLRLLDHPADVPVLAPLAEREILWRLLTGPHGGMVRQVGLAGSGLSHVSRAIRWIRENYAEPVRIPDLARLAGMSPSAFHRHFRAVTAMSPVQFQKCIRLQTARSLLIARPGDVAAVGHLVGYDSPSQFNREYRRLFGAPPGQDTARLRAAIGPRVPADAHYLP